MTRRSGLVEIAFGVTAAMILCGCAAVATTGAGSAASETPAAGGAASGAAADELRLGYFANVTHAPALIGVQQGIFQEELGDTALSTQIFNAGPAAIEALSAGAIDAAYIGPNPSINTFIKSGGQSAHIVAGVTSGGAALVVREGIDSAADLKGATLATPQLGNTQDVALRSWLADEGYATDTTGGGDVHITPTENAQALTLFQNGQLDGAWLPEPWASRLIIEGGAHVLVDEADLWKDGAFPTTVLLVSSEFLDKYPATVAALVAGNEESIAWLNANPDADDAAINEQLTVDAGKPLDEAVLARALEHVKFSSDPVAAAFPQLLKAGVATGVAKSGDINGLFQLDILNELRAANKGESVSDAKLGGK